jgi:hypothetical protein
MRCRVQLLAGITAGNLEPSAGGKFPFGGKFISLNNSRELRRLFRGGSAG